jgi:GNAT superfamily N-acetyltransferase
LRRANEGDRGGLIELVANFLAATQYGELLEAASWTSVSKLIDQVLAHGAIFVVEVDPRDPSLPRGELVAMIAIVLFPHPITGRVYADELAWWVEPKYRRGRIGPKLLRRAEDWARQNGASMLKMVAPHGTDVGRFYEARGFTAVETAYQKRL